MEFYAHTHPDFPEAKDAEKHWEILFTPFGEESGECRGYPKCAACESMDPKHGHLNKVAWWAAKFAEEMFPAGSEDAKSARDWGYLAGLWHDLQCFSN